MANALLRSRAWLTACALLFAFVSQASLPPAFGAGLGGKVELIGGTTKNFSNKAGGRLETADEAELRFITKSSTLAIPYARVVLLEYGQKVDRRYVTALLVSPLFLLAKSRRHYLTIGYEDEAGRQQAVIFQVAKDDVRPVLVGLEARTGRRVTYQDEEARKGGKG